MKLKTIDKEFAVCRVEDYSKTDLSAEFCFIGRTDEENSLVCTVDRIPENATDVDKEWRAFRIEGVLDFSLIGILSDISGHLAKNKIGIFAVSTYNTDYIFTKSENFDKALKVLLDNGYEI